MRRTLKNYLKLSLHIGTDHALLAQTVPPFGHGPQIFLYIDTNYALPTRIVHPSSCLYDFDNSSHLSGTKPNLIRSLIHVIYVLNVSFVPWLGVMFDGLIMNNLWIYLYNDEHDMAYQLFMMILIHIFFAGG